MTILNKDESFISVVTVINRFTQASLRRLHEIQSELEKNYSDYEIILVVLRSQQKIYTKKLIAFLKKYLAFDTYSCLQM